MQTPFQEILSRSLTPLPPRLLTAGECTTPSKKICSLCNARTVHYEDEYPRKNDAVQEWWNSMGTGAPCEPLVRSPKGREYRTVSKRKAFLVNKNFSLGLIGIDEETSKNFPMNVGRCVIEPDGHTRVYATVQAYLSQKRNTSLAEEFNYVIVKGDGKELAVIFNVNHFSSANRKEINHLSKHLTHAVPEAAGVFVFIDEERSRYYLSERRKSPESHRPTFNKIFGADKLFHKIGEKKFLYSPLSFSQTNHSILESFTSSAREMLQLNTGDTLLDLYCGYGLFSICMAPNVHQTVGMELSRSSMTDAIDNAKRNKLTNSHFMAADITVQSLNKAFTQRTLSDTTHPLKVLLDPPRNGTAEGVIERIASKKPARVVHIFCNSDIIAKELERWNKGGYIPDRVVPFDMFPGTADVEVMVSLIPA